MANKRDSLSPIARFHKDLQQVLHEDQFEHIFPLINSALEANTNENDRIARQQQEQLTNNYFMDVDEPTFEDASALDPRRLEEIDRDAAFAAQLQNEEYSRSSLIPYRPNEREPRTSSIIIDSNNSLLVSDAEYAAHLQAEEEQKQRKNRFKLPVPSQRQERPHSSTTQTSRFSAPEIVPVPNHIRPFQHRPSSGRNNHRSDHNDAQILERRLQPHARPHRTANLRIANLTNNDGDFGPNDYERLLQLDNSINKNPLSKGQINEFPTEKYRRIPNRTDENDKCSICMDDYEQDQILRRLPCIHLYHKDCIDQWLKRDNLCPICRVAVTKK